MIGSLITWILAIGAIAIAVVSLLKNFSREGPSGEEGPRGKPGVDGTATSTDITRLEGLITDLKNNLENGGITVKKSKEAEKADKADKADYLKQGNTTTYNNSDNLTVKNSTNLNNQDASEYVMSGYYGVNTERGYTTNSSKKGVYCTWEGCRESSGGDSGWFANTTVSLSNTNRKGNAY